jgi:predicted DNA-binding ribbon-helix-helix protein
MNDLVNEIDESRGTVGLSPALRLYVLQFYRAAARPDLVSSVRATAPRRDARRGHAAIVRYARRGRRTPG